MTANQVFIFKLWYSLSKENTYNVSWYFGRMGKLQVVNKKLINTLIIYIQVAMKPWKKIVLPFQQFQCPMVHTFASMRPMLVRSLFKLQHLSEEKEKWMRVKTYFCCLLRHVMKVMLSCKFTYKLSWWPLVFKRNDSVVRFLSVGNSWKEELHLLWKR